MCLCTVLLTWMNCSLKKTFLKSLTICNPYIFDERDNIPVSRIKEAIRDIRVILTEYDVNFQIDVGLNFKFQQVNFTINMYSFSNHLKPATANRQITVGLLEIGGK